MIAPSYVLAFVFMLSSSLLVWLLWHCRNVLLLRLAPRLAQEEQESNRALSTADIEAAMLNAPAMTRTTGAPQHVISKLPVFKYKFPTSNKDDHSSDGSCRKDQDSGSGADLYPAAVKCQKAADDSTSSLEGGSWMGVWRLPAAEAAQGSAAKASTDGAALAVVAGQDASFAAAPPDAAAADCVPEICQGADQQASRPPIGIEQQQQHMPGVQLLAGPQQMHQELVMSATEVAAQEQQQPQQQQQQQQRQSTTGEPDVSHIAQDADDDKGQAQDSQQLQLQRRESAVQRQPPLQQPKSQEGGYARDGDQACVICFADYVAGDLLKQLPCKHTYHAKCIDRWLHRNSTCPLCKTSVWTPLPTAAAATITAAASRRTSMYSGWGGGGAAASASAPAAAAVTGATRLPLTGPNAQLMSHDLVELQQRRRSSSSTGPSSLGSYGSSLNRWDGMLLNARGPAAAAGAVTAAGAAVLRS